MTREQLITFSETLMSWLTRDPLALGLVSAAMVLVMLALALRWSLARPAARSRPEPVADSQVTFSEQPAPVRAAALPVAGETAAVAPAPGLTDALALRVEALADEVRTLRRQLTDTEALLRRQADKLSFMERQHLLQPVAGAATDAQDDGPRQAGYEQAMLLASHGVPVQELMAQCGLTRPEAQLIVLLHGRGGQA